MFVTRVVLEEYKLKDSFSTMFLESLELANMIRFKDINDCISNSKESTDGA